jgi:zinc transport system permease protein
LIDDFLLRALIGGVVVAIVAAPFGVFIVWRRLAYFGDTLAHSALLGVALGILLQINMNVAVVAVCLTVAVLLFLFQRQRQLADDTLLGILAHSSLSLGLVFLALFQSVRVDLMAYLFGDILAISRVDIGWILLAGSLSLLVLIKLWKPLLLITVHEDIARIDGVRVDLVKLTFVCLLAILVAVMMKIVGLVLVTALFIIPAAAARRVSRSPEMMALVASLIGAVSVTVGLAGSYRWDTPAGPSIVLAAAALFGLFYALPIAHHGDSV